MSKETMVAKLFSAAEEGDLEEINRLIQEGVYINTKLRGETVVDRAYWNGHKDLARLLVVLGAKANDSYGGLLYEAAKAGDRNSFMICSKFVYPIKGVGVIDQEEQTPVELAYYNGHKEFAMEILKKHYKPPAKYSILSKISNKDPVVIEELFSAAKLGDFGKIEELVNTQNVDLKAKDKSGKTIVEKAHEHNRIDMLKTLMDKNKYAKSCINEMISVAIKEGNLDLVRILVNKLNVDTRTNKVMYTAIREENLDVIKLLVNELNVDIGAENLCDAIEYMPVYYTTKLHGDKEYTKLGRKTVGYTKIVEFLLEAGADPTEKKREHNAPIFEAFSHMRLDNKDDGRYLIKLLFEKAKVKVNPNVKDSSGNTALFYAVMEQDLPTVRYLLHKIRVDPNIYNSYDNDSPLTIAIRLNNVGIVKELLMAKADPDSAVTVAIQEIRRNSFPIVELLVKNGANLNTCEHFDRTPLMEAVLINRKKVEESLSFCLKNRNNNPLYSYESHVRAALKNHPEVLEFFTEKGVEIQQIASYISENPGAFETLVQEHMKNHLNIIEFLLQSGGEVNFTEPDRKNTALHYAAGVGNLCAVKLLVKYGANIDLINKAGFTPLDLAKKNEHKEVVTYLQQLN